MIDARWARTEMLSVEIDLLVERARHKAPTSSLLNLKSCSRKSSSTQPGSQGQRGTRVNHWGGRAYPQDKFSERRVASESVNQ